MYIYAKFYVLGNFMKERQSRLKAIKNLIKNNRIESQDDLLSLLLKEGFDVTQATLSRDLKLLKVGKVPDGQNSYMYALPGEDENGEKIYWSLRFNAFMQTMILNTNSCNDAFFNKMIGFLDEYELAYKNYLNNEEQNKIKEDFV